VSILTSRGAGWSVLPTAAAAVGAAYLQRRSWADVTATDLLGRSGGPRSIALAIDDDGRIGGTASGRPFVWVEGRASWLLDRGAGAVTGFGQGGTAVGWVQSAERGVAVPLYWSSTGRARFLTIPAGCRGALATAADGDIVVGTAHRDGSHRAVSWHDGHLRVLDDSGALATYAEAVSGRAVAGGVTTCEGRSVAVVWRDGRREHLEDLGCGAVARAVDASGVVAGEVRDPRGAARPCRWVDGSLELLHTLGGTGGAVHDSGADGVLVGVSADGLDQRRATLWDHSGPHDLGTLGGTTSAAHAVNRHGVVVGIASTGAGALGFALRPGGWSWEDHAFVSRASQVGHRGVLSREGDGYARRRPRVGEAR
jgi:uncharacterized membrane protein